MKGIGKKDDVVTPGLTRVKNKDLKYFKTQAELAKQEAGLAKATAEEVSLHQKILKEKKAELDNLIGKPGKPKGLEGQIDEATGFNAAFVKRTNTANNILAQEIVKLRRQKIAKGETLGEGKYSIRSKDRIELEEVVKGKQNAFNDAKKNLIDIFEKLTNKIDDNNDPLNNTLIKNYYFNGWKGGKNKGTPPTLEKLIGKIIS